MSLNVYPLPTDIEEGPDRDAPGPAPAVDLSCLYVHEAPRLLSLFRAGTRGHHDAEDMTQQAFLQFAKASVDREEAVVGPAAYLSRIARNLLKDRARTAMRRASDKHVSLEDVDLYGPDPVRTLEARDMLMRMEGAIARMKPRTRAIFLAHRIDGLSYREIADRTGLSIKGVEKQMAKAIALLHRTIGSIA